MIRCKSGRRATWYRKVSPMEAPNNACVGSDAASKAAISSAVIPSPLVPFHKAHFINLTEGLMAFTWVVCIDGTWNPPWQIDKDPITEKEQASPSNVAKTWQAL